MSTTINPKFLDLVARMREAQIAFFKTHDSRILTRSKFLEALVDEEIEKQLELQKIPSSPPPLPLFPNETFSESY